MGEAGDEPGCATAIALAGRRAFAVDVQALVVPSEGPPKRQVAGLDPRRFQIVAAVTDRAADLRLARSELYGASSGGLRLDDPGGDLAVAAALASSASGRAVRAGTGFVGELSLTGAIRPVSAMESRVSAAAAAGLKTLICSAGGVPPKPPQSLDVIPVRHVGEALSKAFGGR